jgi:hypothetical protein
LLAFLGVIFFFVFLIFAPFLESEEQKKKKSQNEIAALAISFLTFPW